MEVLYEILVMNYLTRGGDTFICPQFVVMAESGSPWSAPDFVALDFRKKEVQVVEVSVASNPKTLLGKVKDRNRQWLDNVRRQVPKLSKEFEAWQYVVRLFVRKDARERFEALVKEDPSVKVETIEDIAYPWKWENRK
jgi:hypothetical protein